MRQNQPAPSLARLREAFALDVETGELIWKVRLSNRVKIGQRAGCIESRFGYVLVRLDGMLYAAHDLIWFMLFGEWCPGRIDHIDRDKSNNRPANLRIATQQQNLQNQSLSAKNTSGFRGVTWNRREEKWQAQVQHDGRYIFCGHFDDCLQAAHAARQMRLRLWKEFAPLYDHGG